MGERGGLQKPLRPPSLLFYLGFLFINDGLGHDQTLEPPVHKLKAQMTKHSRVNFQDCTEVRLLSTQVATRSATYPWHGIERLWSWRSVFLAAWFNLHIASCIVALRRLSLPPLTWLAVSFCNKWFHSQYIFATATLKKRVTSTGKCARLLKEKKTFLAGYQPGGATMRCHF